MLQQLLSYHKANSKIPIHQLSIPNPGVFSTKISHFKCPRAGDASLSNSSEFSEFSDYSDNGALAHIPPARHRLYEAQREGRLPAPTCANAWLGLFTDSLLRSLCRADMTSDSSEFSDDSEARG